MTRYPTKSEIIDAVIQEENLPKDLRGYKCAMGAFMPLYYQGGFCLVFKMQKENSLTLALRVWFAKVDDIIERNNAIASYIQNNPQEYFVNIKMYDKGLRVPTDSGVVLLDMMTMEWVEGENLKNYIRNILTSKISQESKKNKLTTLAQKMLDIFESMHKSHISHGDLQHTNILITKIGDPVLIDYDSLYFPNSKYRRQITDGYQEYQHPARKKSKEANERTDYFSELIIYLALLTYAEDKNLWGKYNIDTLDYSILFTTDDLQDIDKSNLYKEICCRTKTLALLCNILKEYLSKEDINDISTPFMLYPGVGTISALYGDYCIKCGNQFELNSDLFCTYCGTKRV